MATVLTSDEVAKLMVEGFTDRIRQNIKDQILAKVMPDIDAAADVALAGFKVAVEQQESYVNMDSIIKVILEKRP